MALEPSIQLCTNSNQQVGTVPPLPSPLPSPSVRQTGSKKCLEVEGKQSQVKGGGKGWPVQCAWMMISNQDLCAYTCSRMIFRPFLTPDYSFWFQIWLRNLQTYKTHELLRMIAKEVSFKCENLSKVEIRSLQYHWLIEKQTTYFYCRL